MSFTHLSPVPFKFAICKLKSFEKPVQPNLAMTPADVADMASKGIPVSTQANGAQYYDGVPEPSLDIPIDQQRGADMADIFNAQMDAREKLGNMRRKIHKAIADASRKGGQ